MYYNPIASKTEFLEKTLSQIAYWQNKPRSFWELHDFKSLDEIVNNLESVLERQSFYLRQMLLPYVLNPIYMRYPVHPIIQHALDVLTAIDHILLKG